MHQVITPISSQLAQSSYGTENKLAVRRKFESGFSSLAWICATKGDRVFQLKKLNLSYVKNTRPEEL